MAQRTKKKVIGLIQVLLQLLGLTERRAAQTALLGFSPKQKLLSFYDETSLALLYFWDATPALEHSLSLPASHRAVAPVGNARKEAS